MESAGEKPLSLFRLIPERAVGGARRHAHLARDVVYAVPILPVVRCHAALCLVAATDGHCQASLPHPRPLVHRDAHTRGHPVADQYGLRLLDLYAKTARSLLRNNHRDDCRSSLAVGIPRRSD